MNNLKVEVLNIKDLTPYKNNAKKHPKEQVEYIANSIKEFGMNDPIGIWGEKNTIVEGHGRYFACKKLGISQVPCIRLDDLTDEQRKAYALAHNKVAESEWDFELLNDELAGIDFDMGQFGFEDMADDEQEETEVVEDEAPEPPAEPKSKQGDIYQLGRHRLMCGDSTSEADIAKLIDGNTIDLVLTDPPYGIDIVKAGTVGGDKPATFGQVVGKQNDKPMAKANVYMAIKGDDTTETAKKFYNACIALGIENYILFGGNYFTDFLPPKPCWVVWDKKNGDSFLADVELAWTSFDKGAKLYDFMWNGMARAGDRKTELVKRVHPTQKPVGLMGKILKDFSKENNNILDAFGGSGSTLIACEQLDRSCYMIEYEPHYVDVIIERWENFTGEKAVLLNG